MKGVVGWGGGGLACDVFDTYATHASLVFDVIDTDWELAGDVFQFDTLATHASLVFDVADTDC